MSGNIEEEKNNAMKQSVAKIMDLALDAAHPDNICPGCSQNDATVVFDKHPDTSYMMMDNPPQISARIEVGFENNPNIPAIQTEPKGLFQSILKVI